MKIKIAAKTDIGKHRDQNEDAFSFCPDLVRPEWGKNEATIELGAYGCLLTVADGMGGANAGEVASAIAMQTVRQKFSTTATLKETVNSQKQILQYLQTTIEEADGSIRQYAIDHFEANGLGTTIVLCWLLRHEAYIAWCGDSRCYIFNNRKGLQQLTKDHSYVQELVEQGKLTDMEAFAHPDSNVLTQALGDVGAKAVPNTTVHNVRSGDIIMLCTDGLCGYCTNNDIEKTIKSNSSNPSDCCNALMQLALDRGGYDNITIETASLSEIFCQRLYRFFSHFI